MQQSLYFYCNILSCLIEDFIYNSCYFFEDLPSCITFWRLLTFATCKHHLQQSRYHVKRPRQLHKDRWMMDTPRYIFQKVAKLTKISITITMNNKMMAFEHLKFAKRCFFIPSQLGCFSFPSQLGTERNTFVSIWNVEYNHITYHIWQHTV